MPPVAQEVHEAIDRGARYFKRCIAHQFDPADSSVPISDADPVAGPFAAYGSDVGGPALCLGLPILDGEISKGPWIEDGPGSVGYYPLKAKGTILFSHVNRRSQCNQEQLILETGTRTEDGVSFNYYQSSTKYELKETSDGVTAAVCSYTYESRWNHSDGSASRIIMSVKMLSQDRQFGRLIWFPHELLDLADEETKVVFDKRATYPYGIEVPFLAKNPVRVQRAVSHLLKEIGLYLGDSDSLDWSRKVLTYTQDYELAPDIWDCMFGQTPGHGEDWFHSEEAFRDQLSLRLIRFRLSLSPYQSHTSISVVRRTYLDSFFPNSPYCWALQAIDSLHRRGADAIPYALGKLRACEWDGNGTKKTQDICGWFGAGIHINRVCIPWGTGGILPTDFVYKGDWVTPFFLAASCLYGYVRRFGSASEAQEVKVWADEAAEVVLKMQFPPSGEFENSSLGTVALPHAAGGFIDAYYVNSDGSLRQHGWQSKLMMAAEYVLSNFFSYDEQPVDTGAFGGYFENSLFGLHGLMIYATEVLGN